MIGTRDRCKGTMAPKLVIYYQEYNRTKLFAFKEEKNNNS